MTNPSMDTIDPESQPLLGRNDNVNTPLTGHCYTETDADATTTPATASPGDHDFDFDPLGDVDNPLEWPIALKWGIVTLLALMAFTVYVYPLLSPSLLLPSLAVLFNPPSIFSRAIFSVHVATISPHCTSAPGSLFRLPLAPPVPGSYPLRAPHRTRKSSDSSPAPPLHNPYP